MVLRACRDLGAVLGSLAADLKQPWAVFGPVLAVGVVSAGLLLLAVRLLREPGRWWESTRAGVDLLTLSLSLGLGTAILVPAQWGFLGDGATRLLWILGALLGTSARSTPEHARSASGTSTMSSTSPLPVQP